MAGNGYDKFFKEAQKASGLTRGGKGSAPRFSLNERSSPSASASKKVVKRAKVPQATPEDRLREELALRLKARKQQAVRRKQKFPVGAAVVAVVSFVACGIGYWKYDQVESLLSRVEIGVMGEASAAEEKAATKKPDPKAKPDQAKSAASKEEVPAKDAESDGETKAASVPNTKGWSAEEMSFFSKLSDRKKELDLRESELVKLEEELQKRKLELDEKLKQLESMRADISKTLKTRVATDKEKVDKLVDFYSSMKPQQAAKIIESINEDLAVEVMDKMKKKNAAEIMNMLDAKKARKLSEMLAGYQRSTASVEEPEAKPAPEAE